jgi:hypothetical protein
MLAEFFNDLAARLDLGSTGTVDPEKVVKVAAYAVPHAQVCGLTLIRGASRPRTVAATGELPLTVDALQYRIGEGPCLAAAQQVAVARVDDLSVDRQWPIFGSACVAATGIRSMLSFHLPLRGDDRAAMNFYARAVGVFDETDVGVGSILATFAGLAIQGMVHEEDSGNFQQALSSSRQIGTAVGILMARENVTSVDAFELLKQASNHLHRR